MTTWQAALIGVLQGATELFPVSSLGHAVIIPTLLHWSYRQSDRSFLPFLVLLHLGTATALLVLYRRDWARIIAGFFRAAIRGRVRGPDERLAMLVVVGTVPAGAVGFVLEKPLRALFANPRAAAVFLIVNGALLLGAEIIRRRSEKLHGTTEGGDRDEEFADVSSLTFRQAAAIGATQALALLPGISRSGVTMAGGLLAGLRHQEAARFSFLLATPIIAAAGLLEVPELARPGVPLAEYLLAAGLAAMAAYASARFLIRYFRSGRLDPYGWYCVGFGALALLLLR